MSVRMVPCLAKQRFPTDLHYFEINYGMSISDFKCLGINYGCPFPTSEIPENVPWSARKNPKLENY